MLHLLYTISNLGCFAFNHSDSDPYQHLDRSHSIKLTLAKGQIYRCCKWEQHFWLYWLFLSLLWGRESRDNVSWCFHSESFPIPVLLSLSAVALIRVITGFRGVRVVFYSALRTSAEWASHVYMFLINKCLAFELLIGYVHWQKFNMTGKSLPPIALAMQDSFKQVSCCNKFILLCVQCGDSNGELQCQETQQQQLVVFW